ncbi:hypothetical protein A6F68_02141 [Tsuneonella dongtanensis]|uniref:DUF883 domain-containing protein n=1 Tax=Tsuneonella dongtanensis TaxID=692370 RepID=A0A1B2AER5_9SPHN|nr:hypothetical protein [Tsuneonella dongtanensis]ANY20643.1 hypothetical protein A6F68_02141 [Tsuneonella dongtanensis]
MAEATPTKPKTTRKPASKPAAKVAGTGTATTPSKPAAAASPKNTELAKSRFNAALEEAKAGAAALRSEAGERAAAYRSQARSQSEDWVAEARNYGVQAKDKAGELAVDGKSKVAEALLALGRAVFDTAPTVDEKLGAKYGDYARSASRTLQETSAKIDAKSVDEIGEDAREFVRKSPGLAIGIAAVGGFLLARLFRGSND